MNNVYILRTGEVLNFLPTDDRKKALAFRVEDSETGRYVYRAGRSNPINGFEVPRRYVSINLNTSTVNNFMVADRTVDGTQTTNDSVLIDMATETYFNVGQRKWVAIVKDEKDLVALAQHAFVVLPDLTVKLASNHNGECICTVEPYLRKVTMTGRAAVRLKDHVNIMISADKIKGSGTTFYGGGIHAMNGGTIAEGVTLINLDNPARPEYFDRRLCNWTQIV